jgi:hypothetical protein
MFVLTQFSSASAIKHIKIPIFGVQFQGTGFVDILAASKRQIAELVFRERQMRLGNHSGIFPI